MRLKHFNKVHILHFPTGNTAGLILKPSYLLAWIYTLALTHKHACYVEKMHFLVYLDAILYSLPIWLCPDMHACFCRCLCVSVCVRLCVCTAGARRFEEGTTECPLSRETGWLFYSRCWKKITKVSISSSTYLKQLSCCKCLQVIVSVWQ